MTTHAGISTPNNSALKSVQQIITGLQKRVHRITIQPGSSTPNNSTPKTVHLNCTLQLLILYANQPYTVKNRH